MSIANIFIHIKDIGFIRTFCIQQDTINKKQKKKEKADFGNYNFLKT